jgi:cytochrome c-type biogenesis protein CcmH
MAPCCWVNTLSNHSSALSEQIKGEIRARVDQGQSVDEIVDFYVAKYGERILAAPKASGFNALAWVMPFVFVALGGVACLVWMRRRRATGEPSSGPGPVQPSRVPPDPALVARMEAELAGME